MSFRPTSRNPGKSCDHFQTLREIHPFSVCREDEQSGNASGLLFVCRDERQRQAVRLRREVVRLFPRLREER